MFHYEIIEAIEEADEVLYAFTNLSYLSVFCDLASTLIRLWFYLFSCRVPVASATQTK